MKKSSKKGFTLAELLIVVAIIGVLVAISIPIFSGLVEKAREATDIANIRSAYAELETTVLTMDKETLDKYPVLTTSPVDGMEDTYIYYWDTRGLYVIYKRIPIKQKKAGWQSGNPTIAGKTLTNFPLSSQTPAIIVNVWCDGSWRVNLQDSGGGTRIAGGDRTE